MAVDIDSTLYDFETPFRQAYLDLALEKGDKDYFRGAYHGWFEWRSPIDSCGDDAFNQALAKVHSPECILSRQCFDGAIETLHEFDGEIMYVSSRDPDLVYVTAQWLTACGLPEGEVICMLDDKLPYLEACTHLIDDRPKTLCDFVYEKSGRTAFGLLYEYNRALTDIDNIFLAPTWAGIKFYLQREGVLKDKHGN
jgi:hypothetical protein